MAPFILVIKNLMKSYKTRLAVNNVSFSIAEGEIFGLIGPNGAGKTTIIKCISGLASISAGEITICGKNIKTEFEKAIVNVGAIIETPTLYPYMSGLNNLKYYASLYKKKISKEKINSVVEIAGLKNRINDKLSTYSLGMKQRLGLAQALLHSPKLLILDEPMNGLDANGVKEMRVFLQRLAKEEHIGILISSHILPEMELLCNTVGIVDDGKLIRTSSITLIAKESANNERYSVRVNCPNFAGTLIQNILKAKVDVIGGAVIFKATDTQMQEIYKTLVNNNVSILKVTTVTKSLEDIFLELVNSKGKLSQIN